MHLSRPIKQALSAVCFTLGGIWAAVGALHMLFGTAVTFPLLPPLDLARVEEGVAFGAALVYVIAGALLGRSASRRPVRLMGESVIAPIAAAQSRRVIAAEHGHRGGISQVLRGALADASEDRAADDRQLLEGRRLDYPQISGTNRTFKSAPKAHRTAETIPSLFESSN